MLMAHYITNAPFKVPIVAVIHAKDKDKVRFIAINGIKVRLVTAIAKLQEQETVSQFILDKCVFKIK